MRKVKKEVNALKNEKAVGLDKVTGEMIKRGQQLVV